jgi:hypothetical protein
VRIGGGGRGGGCQSGLSRAEDVVAGSLQSSTDGGDVAAGGCCLRGQSAGDARCRRRKLIGSEAGGLLKLAALDTADEYAGETAERL